jgi:ankyrin repeat protein
LAYGADINAEKGRGFTPLHVAARWGQAKMVRYLLVRGANVNPTTGEGITPLHRAAGSDRVEVGRILLEHGASVPSGGSARPIPIRSDEFRRLLGQ